MTGLSMGGVHACMTAALYPKDVAVVPLLAPRSAAVVGGAAACGCHVGCQPRASETGLSWNMNHCDPLQALLAWLFVRLSSLLGYSPRRAWLRTNASCMAHRIHTHAGLL